MNIPTHTSNVTKYSNFLISRSFKFRTIFFKYYTPINIDEEMESSYLINNQIHSHNARTNNQVSILRVNRSKTKHCVLHNGMIIWNSLPDIFKSQRFLLNVQEQGTKFVSGKILKNIDAVSHYDCIFFWNACNCGFSSATIFGYGYFAMKF